MQGTAVHIMFSATTVADRISALCRCGDTSAYIHPASPTKMQCTHLQLVLYWNGKWLLLVGLCLPTILPIAHLAAHSCVASAPCIRARALRVIILRGS